MTPLELSLYVAIYFTGLTVVGLLFWVVIYHLFLANHPNNKEIEKHFRK